jgi:cytochrome c oxidase assembly factor CtaG
MTATLDAILRSWPFEPWLVAGLVLTGAVYLRGWLFLRRRDPDRWHGGRLAAFLGGLAVVFLALGSPVEPFAGLLLQMHMLQHLLLMMAAPPLLWLGVPVFPLLRGLPREVRVLWVAPLFRWPPLRENLSRLTHPVAAWLLLVAATWLWHVPALYELALRSHGWHGLQHACFLGTGLLFWYAVVRPYPSRPRWSPWLLVPYLILADVQNTALSALFTFSDVVLYPHYEQIPRLGGLTMLDDQAAAGALMWVPGSPVYLVPLFAIGVRLLFGAERRPPASWGRVCNLPSSTRSGYKPAPTGPRHNYAPQPRRPTGARIALPVLGSSDQSETSAAFDLLRVPLLGRFLHWRHARLCLQLPLLVLAGFVLLDGFHGPQVGAMNLAGVLPWIHWRGLVVLGLLVGGNVFCLACPFLLPRTLARGWLPATRAWARRLRSKWLAVGLLVLFLWAYEAFALWDSPWLTAWVAIAYFAAAFAVDGLFRGASFCKYVCPIGQFNFVQSLVSPLEVKVRDPAVCAACRTKDCLRGRDGIPGCELHLYLPRKAGNLDCTFCLDCVHACPHGNVGVLTVAPGAELWRDRQRSGIGRFSRRPDLAALIVVLTFGAFANAAGMTGPVADGLERLRSALGFDSALPIIPLFYLLALLVLPVLLLGGAAVSSRRWGRLTGSRLAVATRYAYALVPLGFGMWLAHYSYHFLTSYETAVPAAQRFAAEMGWPALGAPQWVASCCRPVGAWLPRLEIVFLDLGLLLSLYTGYGIALAQTARSGQALRAFAPWGLLLLLLFAAGIAIVLQPMQMRGTLEG